MTDFKKLSQREEHDSMVSQNCLESVVEKLHSCSSTNGIHLCTYNRYT